MTKMVDVPEIGFNWYRWMKFNYDGEPNEVKDWCAESVSGKYHCAFSTVNGRLLVFLEDEEDLLLFKLRYGESD